MSYHNLCELYVALLRLIIVFFFSDEFLEKSFLGRKEGHVNILNGIRKNGYFEKKKSERRIQFKICSKHPLYRIQFRIFTRPSFHLPKFVAEKHYRGYRAVVLGPPEK